MVGKVLIVEDKEDARVLMKVLIKMSGHEPILAEDGREAIEKAKETEPSLIFMDLAMPVMDGIEATQTLRKTERFANTPIIALTAYGELRGQEAIEAGCNEVIPKPLDFGRLQPVLDKYLGN